MRDFVFISHANPEDNDFALWLTLQLAGQGYAAWCDLTKLLGGEDFWSDIETVIRERAVKFLYVLSRSSNHKPGPLNELSVAQAVARSHQIRDFIVPLKIDDLPHAETNIRLHSLNAVSFTNGWAPGLGRLIEKLEEDGVPKNVAFSPTAVSEWWRSYRGAAEGVVRRQEEYLTNWFSLEPLPATIHFHHLARYGGGITELPRNLPYPAAKHGAYLISFAPVEELRAAIIEPDRLVSSESCPLATFIEGAHAEVPMERREARRHLTNLLRQAWEMELQRRELPVYELSGGAKCCYFTQGMADRDRVSFAGVDGRPSYRQVVGYSTVSRRPGHEPSKRYWHFGLQLKPLLHPVRAFAAKPHVLFSSDGQTIWESGSALHRARRSECKDWWNADWRDRILATMTWLAGEAGALVLPVSSDEHLSISPSPLTLSSPVAFLDPSQTEAPVDVDVEVEDEWDALDDEEGGEAA
ncbi:MAG: toll/interleukin-1 receptor domain-containing protein [Chloroflexota bacterium]|nr:toll/interleukin-1 receptor domain-containing protein [Chloroflexota bacterium]